MKQFFSFIIKETKHIVRDKRTMLMLFGMPIVMMLLFGFAITNDVKNVRVVIVTSNSDYATQQVVNRLAASEYFKITKVVDTPAEAEQVIRAQKADMAVVFAQDFASRKSGYQLMIDATDPNMAQQWTTYANAVINNYENGIVNTKLLYNPQMKSAYNFVPAIAGLRHDDVYFDCARKRERHNGGASCIPHTPDNDCRCQSNSLLSTCFCYPNFNTSYGNIRVKRAHTRLFILDFRCINNIYPLSFVARSTRFYHC